MDLTHPSEINQIPWSRFDEEWWRLHSFSKYPRSAPCSAILLAKQGFVYNGTGKEDDDTIICVFCFHTVKNLSSLLSDHSLNMSEFHRHVNAKCPIVIGQCPRNVTIKERDGKLIAWIFAELDKLNGVKDEVPKKSEANNVAVIGNNDIYGKYPVASNEPVQPVASIQPVASNVSCNIEEQQTPLHQVTSNDSPSMFVTNHAPSLCFQQPRPPPPPQSFEEMLPPIAAPTTHRTPPPPPPENPINKHQPPPQPPPPQQQQQPPPQQQPQEPQEPETNTTSYSKLGIITAKPKRPEYSIESERLKTYEGWREDHHIKSADLAKAGYFFTGYSDCARCFYCGGGLRNWEIDDDVWVEHARWFPKCAFMRQCVGQPFIDVVQELNKKQETISYEEVINEMKKLDLNDVIPKNVKNTRDEMESDVAVRTIIDNGFNKEAVVEVATILLREFGKTLSADLIYEELVKKNIPMTGEKKIDYEKTSISKKKKSAKANKEAVKADKAAIKKLKDDNLNMRQQSQCKICMHREVSVVFLPCGHFCACNDCSFALKKCPMCRDDVKGVVRAFLS